MRQIGLKSVIVSKFKYHTKIVGYSFQKPMCTDLSIKILDKPVGTIDRRGLDISIRLNYVFQ